jgi:hypothetical protein
MKTLPKLLFDLKALVESYSQQLYLLGIEIENLFLNIKESSCYDDAEKYFDLLQIAQESLSDIAFNNKATIPEYLWEFVKQCDRLDDSDLRRYLYKEIQEGHCFFKRR